MNGEQPVILLAEDNDDDVQIIRRAFRLVNMDICLQVVSDGEQAIAYLNGEGEFSNRAEYPLPDLFLLDLKMPRKNGFEVLQWLRAHPTLAPLRTVVLTTSDEMKDVNRAYALCANSFLTKSLDFFDFRDTLQAIFNYWLREARAPKVSRPPRRSPSVQC
jgi:CheY-like chemotaxis protein